MPANAAPSNKEVVRRVFEDAINHGRPELLDDLIADVRDFERGRPKVLRLGEPFDREYIERCARAFSARGFQLRPIT